MWAGRREAEQHIAFNDIVGRQELAALGGADGEAGKVIVLVLVHAGHFCGLTADQRAPGLAAAFRDAADDRNALVGIEFAGSEIVEKKQGFCTLYNEIVDAHGHEIDADGVVFAGVDGDLELGADAVVGRYQNRIGEAGSLEIEQAAETADFAIGAWPTGGSHQRLDLLHHEVAGVDIDARVGIGEPVGSFVHGCSLLGPAQRPAPP